MGVFDKEIKIFRDIKRNMIPTVIDALKRFDFVIVDFVTNKQMQKKGEDGKGDTIGRGKYSPGYARIRIKRGLQVNHIDLRFSGKFHADIEVITEGDQFKINSKVVYADDLVKRYGIDILNVQQQYLEEFVNNYLIPQIKRMMNDELAKPTN